LSNPEAADPLARPARSTRYIVTVTDALGCVGRDSVMLQVYPGVAVESGDALTACADAPVRLPAAVTGGQAPYRYSWSPAAGLDNPSLQSPLLLPRSNATYVVTVTDANGCIARDTLAVSVHRPPVVDAGDDLTLCGGGEGKLSARVSGGKKPYSYAWTPREGLSSAAVLSPEVRPVRSGMYVLTVTDANGCVVRDSTTVFVHPRPTLAVAAEVDGCEGGEVQIGAEAVGGSAPYRYRWSPAGGLSDASVPAPMAAPKRNTTYTVTVTDANGCQVEAAVRVNVQPRPSLRLRDRERICLGASVQLKPTVRGGKPPYRYTWSPATGLSAADVAEPVASPTTPVTYTLRVSDARGCAVEGTVDVDVLAPPVVNAGEDVTFCEGTALTFDARVSGGTPPYSTVWSPSAGLNSVRRLDPTVRTTVSRVYTITVTDRNGCIATDEIAVRVAAPPRARAGEDVTLCAGASAVLSGSAAGGTPPYRYSWTPATGLSDPASATPAVQVTQTTRYTLTVTDAGGCTSTDEVTVAVQSAPKITAPRELTICRNQGRRIEVSAGGGRGPYRYEWTPLAGLSDGASASPVANPIQTTTYTVAVTDANGCRSFATVTVTVLPCNGSDAGEDAVMCDGGEVRLGPTAVDTLYGARYSWTPVTGLSSALAPNPVARPSQSTRYVMSKTNRYDCVSMDTVLVTVHPRPIVRAGEDLLLCPGATAEITPEVTGGTPPYSFRWEPEEGLDHADARRVRVVPDGTRSYRLTVTDANGCSAMDSLRLRVSDPIVMDLERRPVVCQGSEIAIGGRVRGGVAPYKITWSPASGLSDRTSPLPALTATASARYTVTVTDANGCHYADTVHLAVRPAPVAAVLQRLDTLIAAPAARFQWLRDGTPLPEATGRMLIVERDGRYTVRTSDEEGCSAESRPVRIAFASATMELPSLRAGTGDTVDIALRLTASRGLQDAAADTLLAYLPVKKKSMRVISGGTVLSDDRGGEMIRIPGRYRKGEKTLAVLRVVIEQDNGVIPLELASVRWLNGLVRSIRQDGKIRLQ
ncbi:MAG: hypothetical protein RRA94_11480, partial [Bacteroidota bacterium]|nr:hypothetical protein [Bacteroidota bacterium]